MHFSVLSNFLQWSCTTPKKEKIIPIDVLVKEEKKKSWATLKCNISGSSLVVHWLRLHASTAGGAGSIPGQGMGILHASLCGQKKKKKKKENATIGLPKINSTEVKGSSPHETIAWTSLPTTTQNWHLTTCLIVQQPSGLSRTPKNRIPLHSHKFTACVCLLEFTTGKTGARLHPPFPVPTYFTALK